MDESTPRAIMLGIAVHASQVLNAVVVGLECSETSTLDIEAALDHLCCNRCGHTQAMLLMIAALLDERGMDASQIYEAIPQFVAEIATCEL